MEKEDHSKKEHQKEGNFIVHTLNRENCTCYVNWKSGGLQPSDLSSINGFFLGNFGKLWAMSKGFLSFYNGYENGKIKFDMITDSRFPGDEFLLSKYIASQYKQHVRLLNDAASYEALHFKTKGIIGYRIKADEIKLIPWYNARVEKALSEIKEDPDFIHGGRI